MKKIGILGGLGLDSTASFYKEIIRLCQQRDPVEYPQMIINSVSWIRDLWDLYYQKNLAPLLIKELEIIERSDADFISIPCNTVHCAIEDVRKEIKTEILGIHEVVGEEIRKIGYKKVGVMGTKITMECGLYQKGLSKYEIEVTTPSLEIQERVNSFIKNETELGIFSSELKKILSQQIDLFRNQGSEAVILGCTELALIVRKEDSSLPLLNSLSILAKATFEKALR